LKVGTVFKWHNFEDRKDKDSKIKPRWFVYLGKTSKFSLPIYHIICTTTTKLSKFETGGERENHDIIRFNHKTTPFEEDCVLDLNESYYSIEENKFENNNDIELIGELNDNDKRQLYKRILKSDFFSKKITFDIHESFNMDGIEGLKKT
jgi:hypothetical protein